MVLENTFIQIFLSALESISYFDASYDCISKHDAAGLINYSCLKDSHTNPQSYMGNGISYIGALSILYAKTSAGNIKSICLKESHTNYSNNVGISM